MRGLPAAIRPRRRKAPPRPRPTTPFERAVARIVRQIKPGTTLGYGEVALRAGKPGGARLVVRALHRVDGLPWWRVSRTGGALAPQVAREQEQLLRCEGWKGPPRRPAKRRRGPGDSSRHPRERGLQRIEVQR